MAARPTTAARRYAEAAFDLASRDDAHDAWSRDLETLGTLSSDERVRDVLGNPSIPRPQRQQLLADLTGKRVSKGVLNLARLLVDRNRFELLPAIAREYRRLLNRQKGVVEAEVTSAMPLTDDETEAVRRRVEAIAGTKIELQTNVDESLIGGLTVKVAGRMFDASVRGRLERLRAQLIEGSRAR